MAEPQIIDMPASGESVKTYALDLDDIHNLVMVVSAGLANIQDNLSEIQGLGDLADLMLTLTPEADGADSLADKMALVRERIAEGESVLKSMQRTGERVAEIHDAMERGENVTVIAVPF